MTSWALTPQGARWSCMALMWSARATALSCWTLRVATGRPFPSGSSAASSASERSTAIRLLARAPSWRSMTRSPRPTRVRRPTTASMAARFSATKSTRLPSAASAATRLAMVWLLPVPGGPCTTRWAPLRAASITWCCEESASRTRVAVVSSRTGSPSRTVMSPWTDARAVGSPASAAITSWSAKVSPWAARSATIGSLA